MFFFRNNLCYNKKFSEMYYHVFSTKVDQKGGSIHKMKNLSTEIHILIIFFFSVQNWVNPIHSSNLLVLIIMILTMIMMLILMFQYLKDLIQFWDHLKILTRDVEPEAFKKQLCQIIKVFMKFSL